MASITTKDFEAILDRCATAVTAREAIGSPVSRKRFNGAARGGTAEWACSDVGQAALKQIIEALRIERKALNKFRKAARELAKATEANPQASFSPPGKPPAPVKPPAQSARPAPTTASGTRKSAPGLAKPKAAKAGAVAERPRTVVGKARPGARKRGTLTGKPL